MARWLSTRRARIWLAVAAIVLLLCGPLLWQLRPLSPPERQLVGTWLRQPQGDHCFQYHSDRRFASFPRYGDWEEMLWGTWSCDATTFYYRNDSPWRGALYVIPTFLRRLTVKSQPLPILFLSDDRISLGGMEYARIPHQNGPLPLPAMQITPQPPGTPAPVRPATR